VLIRVHATTVTAGDSEMRRLRVPPLLWLPLRIFMGFTRPRNKILGQEFAGEIEGVGKDATRFRCGDQVFGTTGFRLGAYAEFLCLPEISRDGAIALKPAHATFEEAASVPTGGLEAFHLLRRAHVQPGQTILINGAGGSIGTFAVQLAKYYGAAVTAVDSTAKLDMLRAIGAEKVIDYTREDFSGDGKTYDLVFDVPGKTAFSALMRVLTPRGACLLANPRLSDRVRAFRASRAGGRSMIYGASGNRTEELGQLRDLIEVGKIKPVIDRTYSFQQIREAHSYVDTGEKKGNVVITID
jgi:NADPH:quinone reductase-like Zn-dependent oxidoreductase